MCVVYEIDKNGKPIINTESNQKIYGSYFNSEEWKIAAKKAADFVDKCMFDSVFMKCKSKGKKPPKK